MKLWPEKNDIEMYSTHNEQKFVIAEIFIRILKNKIYNTWLQFQKMSHIDQLDDIVNKYNITYHNTTKIEPGDVK